MNSEALSLSRIDVEKYPTLTWNPSPWMHEVSRPRYSVLEEEGRICKHENESN
ncbi:hypothetical protein COMA1_10340 [Candidatus Nitrospira nitrosa]|uniref:Uncharacterized protein n=1 Tax=Candidatus Nitrospira nitrosa TaxID=1742972 RepID=A0A0S4L805_9BACT|nr:hypothetical protein COMA1_10340 [Candidatus Nitrospira nitrosa]